MGERRRNKRLPFHMNLEITDLFKQNHIEMNRLHQKIEIVDISKSGLAFISDEDLPINYYFDAKILMPEHKFFSCVIKIIRKENLSEGYKFGCEFVGLADILAKNIDDYEAMLNEQLS